MAVTMAEISKLRKLTGAGMMDCKNALTETNGDIEAAKEIIRKKGQAVAAKREDREASEGCVLAAAKGDFAAIVALKCETAMQAAAMSPIAVSRDEVPADVVEKELEIAKDKARQEGKKEEMLDKIAQGRLNKFYQEVCLLEQAFVKDPKQTIQQYLHSSNKELTAVACKRITLNEE